METPDRFMRAPRSRLHLILTIAGALGIPAIFLPFTWGESPMSVVLNINIGTVAYMPFAWPFLLSLPVTAASARWLVTGRLSMVERIIAYLLAACVLLLTLSVYLKTDTQPGDLRDWTAYLLPIVTFAFGILSILRLGTRRDAATGPLSAIIAMQAAYLPNCLLCLTSFSADWQSGAYCALATALVYIAQMKVATMRRSPGPGSGVPAGGPSS